MDGDEVMAADETWTVNEGGDLLDADGDHWMELGETWAASLRAQLDAGALLLSVPDGVFTDKAGNLAASGATVRRLLDEEPGGWEWSVPGGTGAWWPHPPLPSDTPLHYLRRIPQPETERVLLSRCIGRRLPGKTWTIGMYHSRGSGGLVRVREREADNNWEDVIPDSDGMVSVLPEGSKR
jgi:hypothetical protein